MLVCVLPVHDVYHDLKRYTPRFLTLVHVTRPNVMNLPASFGQLFNIGIFEKDGSSCCDKSYTAFFFCATHL